MADEKILSSLLRLSLSLSLYYIEEGLSIASALAPAMRPYNPYGLNYSNEQKHSTEPSLLTLPKLRKPHTGAHGVSTEGLDYAFLLYRTGGTETRCSYARGDLLDLSTN